MTEEHERTIVVVGAGFSGTAMAINLLRLARSGPLRIVLVDRAQVGRGIAYASRQHPYLLNVPAGRMGLSTADPHGFVEFARHGLPGAGADDFLPRDLYGQYLETTLRAAELAAPPHVRLIRLEGEAARVERRTGGEPPLRLQLSDGRGLEADEVVLALGNPPPAPLPGAEELTASAGATLRGSRYVEDPWAAPLTFRPEESVLVVGTGLTMADIVSLAADHTADRIVVHAISRRGLVPPSQTAFRTLPGAHVDHDGSTLLAAASHSTRRLVRAVRELCDRTERNGGDWREAITLVRHLAPALWGRMPLAERRRFLRHARSYWDIHRHRLPEQTVETLSRLRRARRLHVHAGRIVALEPQGSRIRATWQPRGLPVRQALLVDRVVNCTGPDYDARRSHEPLVRALLDDGFAMSDPLGLGFATASHGALVDRSGRAAPDLFYIGPMLRAGCWEATAVPELRQHAERLARHLVARCEARAAASVAL